MHQAFSPHLQPHPHQSLHTVIPNLSCMLARRICQYSTRTPSTPRVLYRQATPQQFPRSFHQTPPQYTRDDDDWQTQNSEPTLNWASGSRGDSEGPTLDWKSGQGKEELDKWTRQKRRRRLERPIPEEPDLHWIPGLGARNPLPATKAQETEPGDIRGPTLNWLTPKKSGLQLNWDQTFETRTGKNLKELLRQAASQKIRRRRSRLRDPSRNLVTRYPVFKPPPRLIRKIVSSIQNASSQALPVPSIKIGEAPVLGNKETPRAPREHRLTFNPFEIPDISKPRKPIPGTDTKTLEPTDKQPITPSIRYRSAKRTLFRRVSSIVEHLYTKAARKHLLSEAALRELADIEKQRPLITRIKSQKHPTTGGRVTRKRRSAKKISAPKKRPVPKPDPTLEQDPASVQQYLKNQQTKKEVAIESRFGAVASTREQLVSSAISKAIKSYLGNNIVFLRRKRKEMEEAKMKSEATEAVPNDTNIEIPPSAQEAASKPDLKRAHTSPTPKTEWQPKKKQRTKKKKVAPMKEGGAEEVLDHDIKTLLSSLNISEADAEAAAEEPTESSPATLELTITELSSVGDGLAVHGNRVYVVPFTLPGDKVEAKIKYHNGTHIIAESVKIITPSPDRDDSLVGCKYFSICSGCQFQMLPYEKQLEHKRRVVQKAFANFSNLPANLLPEVLGTMGSPLQYGYRTKLTPHFNVPRKGGFKPDQPPPKIGFNAKVGKYVLDIEDCPIGTSTVREGMKSQRAWVKENLHTFKRGATLLLRESTERVPIEKAEEGAMKEDGEKYVEKKTCITDSNERSVEWFGDFRFDSPAGSFFQNNNSILVNVRITRIPPFLETYSNPNHSSPTTSAITSTSPSSNKPATPAPPLKPLHQNTSSTPTAAQASSRSPAAKASSKSLASTSTKRASSPPTTTPN